MSEAPTRDLERDLLGRYCCVAGMDEVGRGALAGPVAVGVAAVTDPAGEAPAGLRDSKLLSPPVRDRLAPACAAWVAGSAVGFATPAEIDRWGIITALRLAGRRALTLLRDVGVDPDIVIVDGSHNWLRLPDPDLMTPPDHPDLDETLGPVPEALTQVKADRRVSVVAAASVIAKVRRDAEMAALADPGYGWAANKGYASPAHIAGLRRLGPSPHHRVSWRLPGRDEERGTQA